MADDPGPLAGVRVLDLATPRAELAGRALAELGAEVLKIEPPGGAEARGIPPFDGDREGDPEASLYWASVSMGKRSAVVDIETKAGCDLIRQLAGVSDVLIESFEPGYLKARGLAYEDLGRLNPSLIYASITPFGQDGPKAHWPATDLTIEAIGGRLILQGDADRPPVPVGYPHASFHGGMQAAADVVIALNERDASGLGQHLDTSMQAVMAWTLFNLSSGSLLNDPGASDQDEREEEERAPLRALLPSTWECADGYVAAPLMAGALPLVRHIMQLAEKDGALPDDLKDYEWTRLVADVLRRRIADEFVNRATSIVAAFIRDRTKAELYDLAFTGDFRLGPLMTTRDLIEDPQLRDRGYWREVGGRVHPGPATARPAPELDGDADLPSSWLSASNAPHRSPLSPKAQRGARRGEAFEGLKVADFSWVAVGPTIGRALADHGATVVRVESERRMDVGRGLSPWKNGEKGRDRSHWFANFNASKLGLALDLSRDEGVALARRLIDWADVVIESFSPGTMARLGLDYASLSRDRDDLVMLSTSLLGQTGPRSSFAGFGQQGVGLSGIATITGWPDRMPSPPHGAYTDVIAPKYAVSTLAAAIYDRRRTGRGCHIDLSQVEASIRFIEPLVLDETVNGRTAVRPGHDSATACPHGVYAVRGHRQFVALAVETVDQWRALVRIAPLDQFADPSFDALSARREVRDKIDRALATWFADRDGAEVEQTLTTSGIPAARAARPKDVAADAQLWHREFFVPLEHSVMGECHYEGLATRFSAKRVQVHRPAPCLGEHTDVVLRELLGLSDAEIAELRESEVLQ